MLKIGLFLALYLLLSGCYVTSQALHQNELFNTRQPVAKVLRDPATPAKTKEQLERVEGILAFASAEGLNTNGAYGYLIQTDIPVVSYIVQAAEADRLQFVTWWFPVVGSVPYLGYFRKSECDEEAKKLLAAGYDVSQGAAGAFSSLGWFDDPIFSSMLQRNEADLAHLFFHELTHRTLWLPGSVAFNENLAEYVAVVLTREYLTQIKATDALTKYELKRQDKEAFGLWLKDLKLALEKVYDQHGSFTRDALLAQKAETFARYEKAPMKPAFKLIDYVGNEVWNNASLLGAGLYAPDFQRFDHVRQCLGSPRIKDYLAILHRDLADASEPFLALDQLCPPKGLRRVD